MKRGWFLAAVFLSAGLLAGTAWAGEERSKVGKVWLTFDSDLGIGADGSDVEVSAEGGSTDRYRIDQVEVVNEGEDFSDSNPPLIEVTLVSQDEEQWYFATSSSSCCSLSLAPDSKNRYDKVSFAGASREDDNAVLVIRARLLFDKKADAREAQEPSLAGWDSQKKGLGTWPSVDSAAYYQIQLTCNGADVGIMRSVYQTSYDFSASVGEPGAYRFQVRSVREGNHAKSPWTVSDVLTVKSDGSFDVAAEYTGAGWQRAADGARWWWRREDGSYPASCWMKLGNSWYYFDAQGYMATGWIYVDGSWYYLDRDSGAMYAQCRTPDNYWVGADGAYVPGK